VTLNGWTKMRRKERIVWYGCCWVESGCGELSHGDHEWLSHPVFRLHDFSTSSTISSATLLYQTRNRSKSHQIAPFTSSRQSPPSPLKNGRQTPRPATPRSPPNPLHRHRLRRHNKARMDFQHRPRLAQLLHRSSSATTIHEHWSGPEQGKDARADA